MASATRSARSTFPTRTIRSARRAPALFRRVPSSSSASRPAPRVAGAGRLPMDTSRVAAFAAALPYALTGAQERVIGDILADLERHADAPPAGDVGSGRRWCIHLAATWRTAIGGGDGLHGAPGRSSTIARSAASRLAARGAHGAPHRQPVGRRQARIHAQAEAGEIDVPIGTHALIQETVSPRLGSWWWTSSTALASPSGRPSASGARPRRTSWR